MNLDPAVCMCEWEKGILSSIFSTILSPKKPFKRLYENSSCFQTDLFWEIGCLASLKFSSFFFPSHIPSYHDEDFEKTEEILASCWGRFKHMEAPAWFEIACAKNRAVIPNISLIFHELPKEHMAVMHPHTANTYTHRNIAYSSSSSIFFYSFMPFHKAFLDIQKCHHHCVIALHFRRNARSKQSNPLLHVLRINIIFIHKLSSKTAVVLHTFTDGHAQITIKCHAGRLKHTCPCLLFVMTRCVGGRLIWSSERESSSTLTWWI